MAFGIYIHVPYCLQRCTYCDFATYEQDQILPPKEYVTNLKKEISSKRGAIPFKDLDTVYFGGGTPSLLPPALLIEIVKCLEDNGFVINPQTEITIEINPATLSGQKLQLLLENRFNRFSVGVQTFNEALLKKARRKHSAQDTYDTLSLLKSHGVNFSADILFALPTQTLDDLRFDIDEVLRYGPRHISPYCLTVPESNPMAVNRPGDETQVQMFSLISEELQKAGFQRYEISNFALPGFESRHNRLYWDDEPYWGIGVSSHSYLKSPNWGFRPGSFFHSAILS